MYKLEYTFKNKKLLTEAITHRSAGNCNNERLEYLGDAILGFVIADALYHQYPTANEGNLSRLRSKLVKKETLAEIARDLSLGDYLILGVGELKSGGHTRSSILADAVEAIFGAIFIDTNYDASRDVILRIYKKRLSNLSLESQKKDPKTLLQEFLQSKKIKLPSYNVIETKGKPHKQIFSVECLVEGYDSLVAEGSSRRKAEQQVAADVMAKYFAKKND
jgi:ribonuclease III